MLKLNDPAVSRLDVRNMPFEVGCLMADLLALSWKLILPIAMPLSFALPPVVARTLSSVGPVPDAKLAALRYDLLLTADTLSL